MFRSLPLSALLSLLLLGSAGLSDAEASGGPNSSPAFFRNQPHAFRYKDVPGYLGKRRHHRRPLLGGTR